MKTHGWEMLVPSSGNNDWQLEYQPMKIKLKKRCQGKNPT